MNTAAELQNTQKNRSSKSAGDNDRLSPLLHGFGETLEKKILKCALKGLDNGEKLVEIGRRANVSEKVLRVVSLIYCCS